MLRNILILPLLALMASCGKTKEPEFRRIDGFQVKNLGLSDATVRFNVTYFNPNSFGVTVKETALDLRIDSLALGSFRQVQEVSVQNEAEFSIPLEGRVSLGEVLRLDLPNIIGKEVLIQADGSVRVGKGGVFITRPIHYSGHQTVDPALLKNGR